MKTMIYLVLMMVSLVAVAGPEDHKQSQKCYFLSSLQAITDDKIPAEICLEDVALDPATGKVSIHSYFFPKMFENLEVDSLIRQTEDRFSFTVSKVLFNSLDSGCDQGESVKLIIGGEADFVGTVNNEVLNITVQHHIIGNTCHSQGYTKIYKYSL